MIWDTSIWRLGCSNRSKIRSAQKCYLCLRYVVSPMCPGRTRKFWSRGRELNSRPADFSADIMLLDSRALFLTIPYGFAWYLASFVQKLFTTFWGEPLRWHNFFGHSFRFP